jgi:arylsulfatase A-like enzyme
MNLEEQPSRPDRRQFVKGMASAAMLAGMASPSGSGEQTSAPSPQPPRKPNVILYVADQMRWDFIGAHGLNPTVKTPNLDRIARHGLDFTGAVTNQPLCSPSRACMMTGRYATETGMWKLPPPTVLDPSLPTLASVLRGNGYTSNFVGKWHLAPVEKSNSATLGFVPKQYRGGFLDFWEGSNVLELTSSPYEGTIWSGDGTPIHFQDQYRVDFITDRAIRFLKMQQEKPYLLFISQLEPHFQNGANRFIAPKGYAERFQNPYVPPDLLHLPGDWQAQLPDYYGCIEKIDESVGRILQTLEEQNQLDNTIFLFTSDHGCQFRTRNQEYKRSPHDSSIRVPFLMQGPSLNHAMISPEIIGNIDLTPTLLDGAGVAVPASMKGKSVLPLARSPQARQNWDNTQLIQISESMVARALRTREWTYCVVDPTQNGGKVPSSMNYQEYQMYNNFSDPAQLVNLAGRVEYRAAAKELRQKLEDSIVASGEARPEISPARLYP